jgi:hypothetical protein
MTTIFTVNNKFFANGNNIWSTSTDGLTWTIGAYSSTVAMGQVGGLYYNANVSKYFTSSVFFNNGAIAQSSDGINWANCPGIPTFTTRTAFTGTASTDKMYAGCAFGEIMSKQIGASSWTSVFQTGTVSGMPQGQQTFNDIFVDSSKKIYASFSSGLVYSTNGTTWTQSGIGNSCGKIVQLSSGKILTHLSGAAANNAIYLSDSTNTTWSKVTTSGLPSTNLPQTNLAIAVNGSNTIVMVVSGSLYYCTDGGGAAWTAATNPSGAAYDSVRWLSGASKFVAFGKFSYLSTVLTSSDGITWTSYNINTANVADVEYSTIFATSGYTGVTLIDANGAIQKQTSSGSTFQYLGWIFSGTVGPFQALSGMVDNNSILYFTGNGVYIVAPSASSSSGWVLNRSYIFYGSPGTNYMYASNVYSGDLISSDNGVTWHNLADTSIRMYSMIATNRNIIGMDANQNFRAAPSSYSTDGTLITGTLTNGYNGASSGIQPPGDFVGFAANSISTGGRIVYAQGLIVYTDIK